jgi:hypothetical protein
MAFQTVADFEALTGDEALTPAEIALIAACRAGKNCWLGDKRPDKDTPTRRIRASLLRVLIVGGSDECGLSERGIDLHGGWIDGELNLDFATGRGFTDLMHCHFTDQPQMNSAKLGSLNLTGSKLPGLFAQSLKVFQSVFLRNGFHATEVVTLASAEIGGQLACANGLFDGNGKKALNGQGVKVTQSVFLSDGFHATGTVSLNSAEIDGQLVCTKGRFDGNGEKALDGQGIKITQDVFLSYGFHAAGTVDLGGAEIGGQLTCTKGQFDGNGKEALNGQHVTVTQDVFLRRGFYSIGTVDLNSAEIGGELNCTNGRFDGNGGKALNGKNAAIRGVLFWQNVTIDAGMVDLDGTKAGELTDDLASWPDDPEMLSLDGFTYDRIASFTDTKQRLDWLKSGAHWPGLFYPQPYVQLAKILRMQGHIREAQKVAYEAEKIGRSYERMQLLKNPDGTDKAGSERVTANLKRIWFATMDRPLRATVGYGLFPIWSVFWLVLLIALTTIPAHYAWEEGSMVPNSGPILVSSGWLEAAKCPNPADTWSLTDPGRDWETFNRYAWAADLVIPIVDLGQTSAWAPSTERGPWGKRLWWVRWILIAFGWIVSALGAAAITGIIRRE